MFHSSVPRGSLWLLGLALTHSATSLPAADTALYTVRKGLLYTQSDSGQPVADSSDGFGFQADVYLSAAGSLSGASLLIPGSNAPTALTADSSTKFEYHKKKNKRSTLDAAFPSGGYGFRLFGVNDGTIQAGLLLQGDSYPAAPHVTNFTALQAVNANGYSWIGWEAFAGGTTADFIRVQVSDPSGNDLFETANIHKSAPLDGTATSLLLAPGILDPAQTYTIAVRFQKNTVTDRASYAGALGVAGYYAETALSLVTGSADAPDVKWIQLLKGSRWVQTNSTAPVLKAGSEYNFDAAAKAYLAAALTSGTLTFPPAALRATNLVLGADLVTSGFSGTAATPGQFDAAYPPGTYSFALTTAHDGTRTVALALDSVSNAPPAPQVIGLTNFQALNTTQPFTISWNRWTNGGPSDFVQFRIENADGKKVFETPDPGEEGALNGLATNATVDAGVLWPNQVYEGRVLFARMPTVSTIAYTGVLAMAQYYARTEFPLQTMPADLAAYQVIKGRVFSQTTVAQPTTPATNGYLFSAYARATSAGVVTNAFVLTHLGATKPMSVQGGSNVFWWVTDRLASQASLEAVYPFGDYGVAVGSVHDGLRVLALHPASANYPDAPRIANYGEAQLINPAWPFLLTWGAFTNGLTNGFIQLTIADASGNMVFQTPGYGLPNALSGSALSAIIPAGTLTSNQFYLGTLQFLAIQTLDTNNCPGATGITGLSTSTEFRLGTRGPDNPSVVSVARVGSSQDLQVRARVVAQQAYRIEGASNLPPVWVPLATNAASSNVLFFVDPNAAGRPRFFYRAAVHP